MTALLHGPIVVVLAAAIGLGGALAAAQSPQPGQDPPPSGGGYGCKSRGTCGGTLYKDQSNLFTWWYEACSGCHVVQAPRPAGSPPPLTRDQQDLLSSRDRFWSFHADAEADPVLQRLTPRTRMVPATSVRSPYRELLAR
jgi:hypothetical protein